VTAIHRPPRSRPRRGIEEGERPAAAAAATQAAENSTLSGDRLYTYCQAPPPPRKAIPEHRPGDVSLRRRKDDPTHLDLPRTISPRRAAGWVFCPLCSDFLEELEPATPPLDGGGGATWLLMAFLLLPTDEADRERSAVKEGLALTLLFEAANACWKRNRCGTDAVAEERDPTRAAEARRREDETKEAANMVVNRRDTGSGEWRTEATRRRSQVLRPAFAIVRGRKNDFGVAG
jgi:hypothetical protein